MTHPPRIFLIGGTSHVGKSTLAQALAQKLNWDVISTDQLARHPGRPWRIFPETVPPHVVQHYLELNEAELVHSVLHHYNNIWPHISELIEQRNNLIIEGSALWPEKVSEFVSDTFSAVWLTASDDTLASRIFNESHYEQANAFHKQLIEKFLTRTIAFNQKIMVAVQMKGLPFINIDKVKSTSELENTCLAVLTGSPR